MKIKNTILALAIKSFLIISFSSNAQKIIQYNIEAASLEDRTNLKIFVNFKTEKDSVKIKLITDNYGTPNIYQYINSFKGINGTLIKLSEGELERIAIPNKQGEVNIEYVVSYDPKKLEGSAFAPVVNQNYFSIAGCQWLLHIGDDDKKRDFEIKIENGPEDWIFHSSIGIDPSNLKINASYDDLISARIGGGGKSKTFYIEDNPVNVVLKGNFEMSEEDMFSSVKKIVELQRKWFNDYDQPFYQVVINERKNIVAGTAFNNQFVCFVRSGVTPIDLYVILAHEMFHNWFPNQIEVYSNEDKRYTIKNEWFSEGFTTYFAGKLLLEANIISREDFVKLVNEDIQRIADSPLKNAPFSEIEKDIDINYFTSEHKKLAYWRGHLMALKWDSKLQNSNPKNNLSNYIRDLFKLAKEKNGKISEEEFYDFYKNKGIDAKNDYEKHILRGESILLEEHLPTLLADDYKVEEISFLNFEPGFDLLETKRTNVITNLKENTEAYKVGLRNGMEFIKVRNSFRNGEWSKENPLKVTVMLNGEEETFEYIPYASPIKIQQIIRNEKK